MPWSTDRCTRSPSRVRQPAHHRGRQPRAGAALPPAGPARTAASRGGNRNPVALDEPVLVERLGARETWLFSRPSSSAIRVTPRPLLASASSVASDRRTSTPRRILVSRSPVALPARRPASARRGRRRAGPPGGAGGRVVVERDSRCSAERVRVRARGRDWGPANVSLARRSPRPGRPRRPGRGPADVRRDEQAAGPSRRHRPRGGSSARRPRPHPPGLPDRAPPPSRR